MFLELRQIGESPGISWKCDVMSRQVSGMTYFYADSQVLSQCRQVYKLSLTSQQSFWFQLWRSETKMEQELLDAVNILLEEMRKEDEAKNEKEDNQPWKEHESTCVEMREDERNDNKLEDMWNDIPSELLDTTLENTASRYVVFYFKSLRWKIRKSQKKMATPKKSGNPPQKKSMSENPNKSEWIWKHGSHRIFCFLFHVATTNIKRDMKEIRNLHINPKNQLRNYVQN